MSIFLDKQPPCRHILPFRKQVLIPIPYLGEHNNYVYGELLGMSMEQIKELEKDQIIGIIPLPDADGTRPQAIKE